MSFLQGDDGLIRRYHGIMFVLTFIVIALVFAFGLVQLLPKSRHDETCTFVFHPLLTNRFFQIDEPLLPRHCVVK